MTITPAEIKACRESLGLNMDEFAAKLGFTGKNRRSNVSRYENPNRRKRISPHPLVEKRIRQLMKQAEKISK